MRKRQLKRLEAKHNKMAIRIDTANAILDSISYLKSALKLIKNNPKARVSVAVVAGEDIVSISDCFDIPNEDLIDVVNDRVGELQREFKRI